MHLDLKLGVCFSYFEVVWKTCTVYEQNGEMNLQNLEKKNKDLHQMPYSAVDFIFVFLMK